MEDRRSPGGRASGPPPSGEPAGSGNAMGIEEDRAWLRAERSRLSEQESALHGEHVRLDNIVREFMERLRQHRLELEHFHHKLDDFHKRFGSVDS